MSKPAIHHWLWGAQILLALLFLFAGSVKLSMPIDELAEQAKMPGSLLRFVSIAELLGAAGLILPGLFGIRTGLTALAASGLSIIMIGAIWSTARTMGLAPAAIPAITGVILVLVIYGRTRIVPLPPR